MFSCSCSACMFVVCLTSFSFSCCSTIIIIIAIIIISLFNLSRRGTYSSVCCTYIHSCVCGLTLTLFAPDTLTSSFTLLYFLCIPGESNQIKSNQPQRYFATLLIFKQPYQALYICDARRKPIDPCAVFGRPSSPP